LYFRDTWFNYWLYYKLSWLRYFVVFLDLSKWMIE
jgi:hypothetical protein